MIRNVDAVRIIDEHRDDGVIITTMNAGNSNFGLPSVTQHEVLDFPLSGCMGKASSIALGLALARPEPGPSGRCWCWMETEAFS